MSRRVVWSPTARGDLIAISRYIAVDNPTAARSVTVRLRAVGEALGQASTGRPGRVGATFEKSVAGLPYVIAYEVITVGRTETVSILHVIHTARNWLPGEWPE